MLQLSQQLILIREPSLRMSKMYVLFTSPSLTVFKQGKTIYHVDKMIRETGIYVDDGLREIFVNTAVNDGSDISELCHVF